MGNLNTGSVLINRYRIVKRIGGGGFADIYRAWDLNLGRACAIKQNLETSPAAQQQFEQEARILANLNHPSLPRVTDHFSIPGQGQYLVMDYVEGEDLQEILERSSKPLSEEQVLAWIDQVNEALIYLHSQKVIHRDIKPANIKITPQGKAVLVDFGIAKVYDPSQKTTTGARGVTPGFSPPEQYGQGHTDERSDIYAVGATLYTLLSGHAPPESVLISTRQAVVTSLRSLNPAVSTEVDTVIQGAMRFDPAERFQKVTDFRAALNTPRSPPGLNRQQLRKVGIVALACLVVVGVAYATFLILSNVIQTIQSQPLAQNNSLAQPVSANGYILFTSDRDGKDEIYRLTKTTDVLPLTTTPAGGSSFGPALDPMGYVFYTSDQDGKLEIYRLDRTLNPVRITDPSNGDNKDPAPDPNGYLLFSSNRSGKYEIYRMDRKGNVTRVTYTPGTAESWEPAIDPRGNLIFTSNRDGKAEIYRLDNDAKANARAVRVTNTPGQAESHSPVADPYGYIMFVSNRESKNEIYRLTWEHEVIRVTHTPDNGESWHPSVDNWGNLLFTTNRDGNAEVYRLEYGKAIRITTTPNGGASYGAIPDP